MKLRLDRTKMAMDGNFFCYDVKVPVSEVDRSKMSYFIISDRQEYVLLEDATRPAELDRMPFGLDRYNAFCDHEKACKLFALRVLKAHFPELAGSDRASFVSLPGFAGSHETIEVAV